MDKSRNSEGFSNKIKFPLWLYHKTMDEVNYRFTKDNCGSRSKFIEKAINFYIGFLPVVSCEVIGNTHNTPEMLVPKL